MKIFGLIGYPLGHSWSPAYFNTKFKEEGIAAEYRLFSLPHCADFPELLNTTPNLAGLNVTIPHKQAIIPYLDALSPEAEAIGAVNTIAIHGNTCIGHNTDAFGFAKTLEQCALAKPVRALILGTGGSAKAVAYVLARNGIPFMHVSRNNTGQLRYAELTEAIIQAHELIINCTPVGMAPNGNASPNIPYAGLTAQHLVIDLIYNPPTTQLLQRAAAQGAKTMNGLYMLHQQAEKAWEIWLA